MAVFPERVDSEKAPLIEAATELLKALTKLVEKATTALAESKETEDRRRGRS